MDKGAAIVSFAKLAASAAVAGGMSRPVVNVFDSYVNVPVWGMPVSVLGAAAFGAGLSLFFGDPIESRRSLYGQIVAATVFGTAGSMLLGDAMDWKWAQENVAMFALIAAAIMRWFLQPVIDRGKGVIHEFKLPRIKRRPPYTPPDYMPPPDEDMK